MTSRVGLCFVFLFSMAMTSNAQVGTLEEVLQAAYDNNEKPEHIKKLMIELSKGLDSVAYEKMLGTPEKQLAWFLTTGAIVTATAVATHGGCASLWDGAWDAALDSARNAAWPAINSYSTTYDTGKAAYNATLNIFMTPARDAASKFLKDHDLEYEGEGVRYRVAQWQVLNFLLTNINSITETVFETAEGTARDFATDNPFESREKAGSYIQKHFGDLKPEVMLFLKPWLKQ